MLTIFQILKEYSKYRVIFNEAINLIVRSMKDKKVLIVSFLQSLGLITYCFIVGSLIFNKAEDWFGPMNETFGSMLFLLIFVVSALICALIVFAYPVSLFIETKKGKDSIKIVGYTAGWLLLFVSLSIAVIAAI